MKPSTLAAAVLAAGSLGSAQATTLLSENFSAAAAGLYGVGPIGGTGFAVTSGNIDIIGIPAGSPFNCVRAPGANCLDLVGNTGTGAIASTASFNLVAGSTYTLNFGGLLQGPFVPGGPDSTSFAVSLGSMSSTQTANASGALYSISFTPLANETGVKLAFTTLSAPNFVHGVVLDSIVLNVTAVPEPGTWALMLAGVGGLIVFLTAGAGPLNRGPKMGFRMSCLASAQREQGQGPAA